MTARREYLRWIVVVLAALAALAVLLPSRDRWRESDCKRRLQMLEVMVLDFEQTHDGKLPSDLDEVRRGPGRRWVLVCPATEDNMYSEPEPGRCDYSLIDWSPELRAVTSDPNVLLFQCPQFAKYPLIYDARLSNHGGRGINVILVDGTVFWDQGGAWSRVC